MKRSRSAGAICKVAVFTSGCTSTSAASISPACSTARTRRVVSCITASGVIAAVTISPGSVGSNEIHILVTPPGGSITPVANVTARPVSDPAEIRKLLVEQVTGRVRWRAGEPGQTFQFQLADEESFAKPVIDMRVDGAEAKFKRPKGGSYYMHVKTIDSDGTVF